MSDAKVFESLLNRYFSAALADDPVWANHSGLRAAMRAFDQ